ncbi:MAG: hypothetical protein JWQ04_3158 [Pedosphaera sp.]|nr:hypothetical protein [Pedosphaera sp.]
MADQDKSPQAAPKSGSKTQAIQASLKAVAMDIFKKSQRLPPLSLLLRKRGQEPEAPPQGFEFGDFYHM